MIRRTSLVLLALLLTGPAVLAARGDDPDWPCQQRLVPQLEASSLWSDPRPSDEAWRDMPEIATLVEFIAPRSIGEDEGLRVIGDYAARLGLAERRKLLPLIFTGLLEETNRQRTELIGRIKAFARRQRGLAEAVNRVTSELDAMLPVATDEAAAQRAELEQRQFFLAKSFQDTERTLRYACEAPVRLEARLGAYARALQAALPGN